MKKIAIIGAGISGLSAAHFLKDKYKVTLFEKENKPGGLIKCERINGSLFHTCGGHVFNSKRTDVLDWFWSVFSSDTEFDKADRNSVVIVDSFGYNNLAVPYPIENHMYMFNKEIQFKFIEDLIKMAQNKETEPNNFSEFLKLKFGETLYNLYFKPYNEKVWRRPLETVSLSWLEGKLSMPSVQEMMFNNMNHVEEKAFVHSTFWYERSNGSQFIADKLADGLDIRYNSSIDDISYIKNNWIICGEKFDKVIYCGNVKDMVNIVRGVDLDKFKPEIDKLEYHGTTAVFCEIDKNPYSWVYQPSAKHESHRIICTGNFADSNNGDTIHKNRITATIEFTDFIDKEHILANLQNMPFNPSYIAHKYNQYTYPIQHADTRNIIKNLKSALEPSDFYFTGRFADWEYYNMDVAIGAAKDLCKRLV